MTQWGFLIIFTDELFEKFVLIKNSFQIVQNSDILFDTENISVTL